jgi:hypothetical protein
MRQNLTRRERPKTKKAARALDVKPIGRTRGLINPRGKTQREVAARRELSSPGAAFSAQAH